MIPGTLPNTCSLFATSNSALTITVKFWHTQTNTEPKQPNKLQSPTPQSLDCHEIPPHSSKLLADLVQYPTLFLFFSWNVPTINPICPVLSDSPPLPPFLAHIISVHVFLIIVLPRYILPVSVAIITMVYYY